MAWNTAGLNLKGPKGDPGDPGGGFAQLVGDGTATSFTITHNLGTRGVAVSVFDASSWSEVECDVVASTVNTVTVSFADPPAVDEYSVAVISGGLSVATGVATGYAPVSASSPGTVGQIAFDTNYLYVAVGADTWKRVALNSW